MPYPSTHEAAIFELIRVVGDVADRPQTAGEVLTATGLGTSEWAAPTVGSGDVGSGDEVDYGAVSSSGQVFNVLRGTAASPDTLLHPVVKVSRSMGAIAGASITGDGSNQLAAIQGAVSAAAGCEVQPVGVMGYATTAGTTNPSGVPAPDAAGVYGVGRVTGSGIGIGMGGFFEGRTESASGKVSAVQLQTRNGTGGDVAYNATGFAGMTGGWVAANSDTAGHDSAAGLQFAGLNSCQWDVGIGFSVIDSIGACKTNNIRIDDSATTAVLINGTHSVAAMAVASGSGKVLIGGVAELVAASKFEVQSSGGSDPLVVFGTLAAAHGNAVHNRNSAGVHKWFVSGSTNGFITGSASGDSGFVISTAGKKILLGIAGLSVITVENTGTGQLAFFGATTSARASAYTQTYSTADKTHANPTATVLTDNTAGTATTTLEALTSGTVYATDVAAIRNNFADLAASNNLLIADIADVKQLVNSVIDDLQAYGLFQ